MSSPPHSDTFRSNNRASRTGSALAANALLVVDRRRLLIAIRALGFWAAIVLPFLHIPLLATGFSSSSEAIAFVGLLALNVVAIRIGYRHRPRSAFHR